MSTPNDNLYGAAFMAASMAGYIFNDAFIRLGASELGLYPGIFWRGLLLTGLIGLVAALRGASIKPWAPQEKPVWWRVGADLISTFLYLTALLNMPFANATAILQVTPLAITLAAALWFSARVGWRRYGSILFGFAGVLIVIRPDASGFNAYSLLALAAVCSIVVRDLATKQVSNRVSSLTMAFITSLIITIAGGLVSLFTGWRIPSPIEGVYLAGAAGSLFFGYLFGIKAMRRGELSFVAPFRYTIMIWALLIGVVVFAEVPDFWTLLGCSMIVAAGVYAFYREQRAIQQRPGEC